MKTFKDFVLEDTNLKLLDILCDLGIVDFKEFLDKVQPFTYKVRDKDLWFIYAFDTQEPCWFLSAKPFWDEDFTQARRERPVHNLVLILSEDPNLLRLSFFQKAPGAYFPFAKVFEQAQFNDEVYSLYQSVFADYLEGSSIEDINKASL
jgi:hypothetical protein